MTQSTVYPEKVKILGNKVYVRDLDSVVEKVDENGTTIYSYDVVKLSKDVYMKILQQENKELEGVVGDLTQMLIDKGVIF
jgi:hypothetical protein